MRGRGKGECCARVFAERGTLRFQSFLVNKKQREAAAAANGAVPGTPGYRSW